MRFVHSLAAAALLLAPTAACKKTGMGPEVRNDVTARMTSIQAPVQMCYSVALERNRKLRGTVMLSFVAAPSTGQFEQVQVVSGALEDPTLMKCVVDEVSKLKLETPQKTAVAIEYPIRFQPTK